MNFEFQHNYVSAYGHVVLIQHAQALSMPFSKLFEVRDKDMPYAYSHGAVWHAIHLFAWLHNHVFINDSRMTNPAAKTACMIYML